MSGRGLLLGAAALWAAYAWSAHLRPDHRLRRGPAADRRIALTFDDGPDPAWTPRVLDLLAERGVRASFFLVGARAAGAPALVGRMAAEGHDVESHGWSHTSLWRCGPRRTAAEVGRAQALLTALAGRAPAFFRPPWGMRNAALPRVLRRHRLRCLLWSIQPEGLRPRPADRQVQAVLARAHPGAVVDLHDAEGTRGAPARLCQALPPLIDGLRAAGYRLTTVGELFAER